MAAEGPPRKKTIAAWGLRDQKDIIFTLSE